MKVVRIPYRGDYHLYTGLNYANNIQEICKELFTRTPINYFSITRVYSDNSYSDLFTDPIWIEHYFKEGYVYSRLDEVFNVYAKKDNFYLWETNPMFHSDKLMKNFYEDLKAFNYTQGITFTQSYPEYIENYHFCNGNQWDSPNFSFLQNLDLLKKFIFYIKEKIFSDKELKKAFLTRHFFDSDKIEPSELTVPERNNKIDLNFDISKFYLDDSQYLTMREIEILKYVIRNYSSKEIGRILSISHRTIETFIEKIKLKTNCRTMRNLTNYAINNQILFNLLIK